MGELEGSEELTSERGHCEAYRSVGYDPTAENGILCNTPNAGYCSICEVYICAECHRDMHEAEQPPKKLPATAADMIRRIAKTG